MMIHDLNHCKKIKKYDFYYKCDPMFFIKINQFKYKKFDFEKNHEFFATLGKIGHSFQKMFSYQIVL